MKTYNPMERFNVISNELDTLIKQLNEYSRMVDQLRLEITARNGILRELQPYLEGPTPAAEEVESKEASTEAGELVN